MGQRVTRERQRITIGKELAKWPIVDRKKYFRNSIYSVCGNKMRFFGKRPHTEMSIQERVEYFTEMNGKITYINCARFANSKLKGFCSIVGQV